MTVRSKTIREGKTPTEPDHDESELPLGWAVATLQEVGAWRSGGTPSRTKSEYFGQGIPWVKSGDLPDGPITKTDEQITQLGLDNSAAKLMPPGTICMALYGATIGKLGTMTFEAATNQATANLVPDERLVDGKYVFYYLMSERQNFIDLGQGGAQPNISQEIVRNHPIRLAPLAEQQRIVGKLELLLGKVSSSQKRLSRVPGLLKRFRQSVLAAACSGKLTADWREENPELEAEWLQVRADEVCEAVQSGSTPKAPLFQSEGGVPFLKVYNIVNQAIAFEYRPQFVSEDTHRTALKRASVLPGDVLMNIVGPPLGKVAIVPNDYPNWSINQAIAMFRPRPELDRHFLYYLLCSGVPYAEILSETRGSAGQSNISLSQCRGMLLPLPPLSEQQEIVRRVEKLFAFADQIEARLRQAQWHVDRLTQSLLAKAFRGKLVPTEAELARRDNRSYEPASRLLGRIQAEQNVDSTISASKSKRVLTQQ